MERNIRMFRVLVMNCWVKTMGLGRDVEPELCRIIVGEVGRTAGVME